MDNFVIKIEFGSRVYQDDNTQWVDKYINDIIQYSQLTDEELKQYAEEIKKSIERNLFTGQTFEGNPVTPLSPSTITRKGHSKVFFDTGELYRSVAMDEIPNGFEIFILPGRADVAYYLQEGTSKMPARPFFGIIPERADSILNEIFSRSSRRLAA